MPTYDYQCATCKDEREVAHGFNDPAPECHGPMKKLFSSFGIGAAALITRNSGLVDRKQTEKEYTKNRPAYERLRREGLQPKKFTDAARKEATAVSKYEIESGHDFKGDERKGRKADATQLALRTGSGIEV